MGGGGERGREGERAGGERKRERAGGEKERESWRRERERGGRGRELELAAGGWGGGSEGEGREGERELGAGLHGTRRGREPAVYIPPSLPNSIQLRDRCLVLLSAGPTVRRPTPTSRNWE